MSNFLFARYKSFVDLEVRSGVTAGEYSVTKLKMGSMPKKDLANILVLMHEITAETQKFRGEGRPIPLESVSTHSRDIAMARR